MMQLALGLFIPSAVCVALTVVSYMTPMRDAGAAWAWVSLIAVLCSGVLLEMVREWEL